MRGESLEDFQKTRKNAGALLRGRHAQTQRRSTKLIEAPGGQTSSFKKPVIAQPREEQEKQCLTISDVSIIDSNTAEAKRVEVRVGTDDLQREPVRRQEPDRIPAND